ncbi:MAG: methylmalonyl-CoA mutase family protein [Chloroflexota bacterium]
MKTKVKETVDKTEGVLSRSGIPLKPVYTPADLNGWDYKERLGEVGKYPFTRGMPISPNWEDFAGAGHGSGFGSPESTNKWLKFLISEGADRVSATFMDLPTQIGYDSDHPMAEGEVGKAGVSINSLADLETVFDGIPTDKMVVSSLANAIGPIFTAWAVNLLKKRGVPLKEMRLGCQNECLKEIVCRGTQIFPIREQVKFNNDVVEYCARNGLKYATPITVCGSHFRQAGATAPQEMAFALADAVAYYEELLGRGLKVDEFAPYVSGIFLGAGMDLFEEICKLRAFRRMWARIMREKFGSKIPPRVHSRGNGRDFTAQQPLNNIIRGTIELLAVWLGGCPGGETSCYDEALAIPTEESVRLAARTRQIITFESGVLNTADPLAGSYYVESLTDSLEEKAQELFDKVQSMGGAIIAIEQGFFQSEIARSSYEKVRQIESGERIWVGVNKYVTDEPLTINLRKVDAAEERRQVAKVKRLKKERDNAAVKVALKQLKEAARAGVNVVPVLIDAVKTYATVGEMCDTLRSVWGSYKSMGL